MSGRPFVTRDHVAEKLAYVAAARGRSRRAVRYRNEARQYEAAGNLDAYRACMREAADQQRRAWDALSYARLEASYG